MLNPHRLIIARKHRYLTKKELADLANITPATVTRLEKAQHKPDPDTLEKIAKVLRFPMSFFFGDDLEVPTADSVSFRSMTAMTAKERDRALSMGAFAYMISDWVMKKFSLPEPDLLNLSHENHPTSAAIAIRQHWGLGEKPIGNMMGLLESKGIRFFSLAKNSKNVDAFSCWRNDIPYIFLNTIKSSEHNRFDAAHELGHLVLHRHGGPNQGKQAEWDANNFASSFLMPRADLMAKIPRFYSIHQLINEKKRWKVSLTALGYRLHKVGVLSDWQYRTFCIEATKRGYRTNEPDGIPPEKSVLWEKVFIQLWKEKVTIKKIAKDLHIPSREIEDLIFRLGPENMASKNETSKPTLKVIK